MKSKQIIRFYFSAGDINKALDNLILDKALKSANYEKSGEFYAEQIAEIIAAKGELSLLWGYLDGVIKNFTKKERSVLKFYGGLRVGALKFEPEVFREIRRVLMKFRRHAVNLERFGEGVRLVREYYCLFKSG